MFVGLSIHHGGDLEKKAGSVAGFVASLDRDVSAFYSRTIPMRARQQVIATAPGVPGLMQTVRDAIAAFKQKNGKAPECLVFYRDGGSEGELELVDKCEVKEIREALQKEVLEASCTLTFFVVLKKIRTRYFAVNPQNPGEVSNPLPGTVVDTNIVSPVIPEFFICCQSVNQGSATPTKYQKIYDNSSINTDTLQMYTYCLAHQYFNWPGTVREPCVMHYASLLAKHTGQVLKGESANPVLQDKLFYL